MWLGPKFRGHVTKNEDKFQKSDRLNFRYRPLMQESVITCQPPL